MKTWEEAYDEFLNSVWNLHPWDLRPSYVIGWINHPLLPGNYEADLMYIFHGTTVRH